MVIMITLMKEGKPAHFMWKVKMESISGDKEEIISFEKYPEDFTCHIRDPKVWKKNNRYYMFLEDA